MSRILTLVFPLLIPAGAFTQTVHTIPFASSGNAIELVVANKSSVAVGEVRVALTHAPVWLQIIHLEERP